MQAFWVYFVAAFLHVFIKQFTTKVVSTIISGVIFESFSYCGDCYQQKSFLFVTSQLFKKSSYGDGTLYIVWVELIFSLFYYVCLISTRTFQSNDDVGGSRKKKESWATGSTIRERLKNDARYYCGDYYKNIKAFTECTKSGVLITF